MLDGLRDLFLSALRGEEKADVLVRKWNAEIKAIQEIYDKARDGEQISAQTEQKKGEWIRDSRYICGYNCSVCDSIVHRNGYNFCPNCGADMRPTKENGND